MGFPPYSTILYETLALTYLSLQIFSYDFDLLSSPLRTYQLVEGATRALLMDRMLFVISHNDEADPCSVRGSRMYIRCSNE